MNHEHDGPGPFTMLERFRFSIEHCRWKWMIYDDLPIKYAGCLLHSYGIDGLEK